MFIKTSVYLCHDLVSFNFHLQNLMSWGNCFNQLSVNRYQVVFVCPKNKFESHGETIQDL